MPLLANRIQGSGAVQAEIAAQILENVANGNPPFRPDLGRVGGVSWFVTEGDPYTGVSSNAATLPVDIEVPCGAEVLEFREADLIERFEAVLPEARELAEAQFRTRNDLSENAFLNSRARNSIEHHASRIAERAMWANVGEEVAQSRSGLGRVVLESSRFSRDADGVCR